MDTTQLQPYQQRVVEERDELAERLKRLNVFLSGTTCVTLDPEEQRRLRRQAMHMEILVEILSDRIAAFVAD